MQKRICVGVILIMVFATCLSGCSKVQETDTMVEVSELSCVTETQETPVAPVVVTAGSGGGKLTYYACLLCASLPVVIIYASSQTLILKNIAVGGLKG